MATDAAASTIVVSDYAMQHADHYGLRKTTRYGGRVVGVELALTDLDGEFIDEAGCNCDLDDPCNNPRCVMERGDDRGAPPTHRR